MGAMKELLFPYYEFLLNKFEARQRRQPTQAEAADLMELAAEFANDELEARIEAHSVT